jgi:magnesium-protoporphyrin O-methyltransferase
MTGTGKDVAAERDAHEVATGCCSRPPDARIARRFDQTSGEWAEGDGFPDMVDVSAKLLDLLRDAPLRRPSVLEMGSGTGGLSVALLEMGAARVTGVDLSQASVDLARRRSVAAGVADRATFEAGNAAEAEVEPHDWVVLDRVICCFADCDRLVERATGLANERIGITLPESRGWRGLVNRPMWAAENIWDLLNGGCRGFVHDVRRIEQRLAAAGFQAGPSARVGLWHIGIYERGRP